MFELSLMCPEDRIEAVSDALDALDALSVSVEDADAQTDAEQALFGEPGMPPPKDGWQRSRVVALFPTADAAQEAQQLLTVQDFFEGCQVLGVAEVPEQDWVRLTQSQFAPVDITPDFWIVPTWHELPPQAVRSIRLDPGLAFGTGTHPTTRMCLRWIARNGTVAADGSSTLGRVLDYGCGSGILAIAALKLGAGRALGVDIDPQAVQSSRDNAAQNAVQADFYLPGELPDVETDVVVANILANPLRMLGALLTRHVRVGGRIVLSGILQEQAEEIRTLYQQWFEMDAPVFDDGWTCLSGRKR